LLQGPVLSEMAFRPVSAAVLFIRAKVVMTRVSKVTMCLSEHLYTHPRTDLNKAGRRRPNQRLNRTPSTPPVQNLNHPPPSP